MESGNEAYLIRAHAPGCITVAYPPPKQSNDNVIPMDRHRKPALVEEILTRSFIIAPRHLIRDWPPQRFEELAEAHLQLLTSLSPEVVLLGTGARLRFPNSAWLAGFHQQRIGVEIMDTGAACRTYNVLMAEGRKVAAALIQGM